MRIDEYIKAEGLAASRSRAKMLINKGAVTVNGSPVTKASYEVRAGDEVLVCDLPYVSRGGLKLEAALIAFSLSPSKCVALDIGASSGGFTDCLLQKGAALVYAVDSGNGQLAKALASDPRVVSMEGYNARYMKAADFEKTPTFAVMDVSFISQTLILPALSALLPRGATVVTLIKPQFEVGRTHIGRGGIVRDEKARQVAVSRVFEAARLVRLAPQGYITSPICGGDGNIEFLAHFIKEGE
ncbi:MAG: TlyA family RNA methyltransferase [Clostridia bacterium]|nr:TlyA family RNA methyltransferase [Clostridia bacterium]